MADPIIFRLDELLNAGMFGRVLSSKEVPRMPPGKKSCPLPGKWVAHEVSGVWYIELGGIDDWHDMMLRKLTQRTGESKNGFSDGILMPVDFPCTRIEVRVGRNDGAIPEDVKTALAAEVLKALQSRIRGA